MSDSSDSEDLQKGEVSALAQDLRNLHSSALKAVTKREVLPQPLFWSLFLGQINEIRRRKAQEKLLSSLLAE